MLHGNGEEENEMEIQLDLEEEEKRDILDEFTMEELQNMIKQKEDEKVQIQKELEKDGLQ